MKGVGVRGLVGEVWEREAMGGSCKAMKRLLVQGLNLISKKAF